MRLYRVPGRTRQGLRRRHTCRGLEPGCWSLPGNPVKEGAGWLSGVWDDLYSTAAVLVACPEDRPADFFSPSWHRADPTEPNHAGSILDPVPPEIGRNLSGHPGRPS